MQTLEGGLEQAVDAVGAGDLQQRAQDLRGAEGVAEGGQGGGVEVVDEGADGGVGVGEVEQAGAVGGVEGVGRGGGAVDVEGAAVLALEGGRDGAGAGGGEDRGAAGCSGGGVGCAGRELGRDGEGGVARRVVGDAGAQRGDVVTVVQGCGAFAQQLCEVGAPAAGDYLGVDRHAFAAHGQDVHVGHVGDI
ncbi:hypothetical protein FH972_021015 [Carpinus fangiana]|uniref:Uncharacterized protein n=1 Tax=Carpinus fangiana TaxID=176857 RepID=A0A5N6KNP1_9ROSI|nr:hypothetical protein FH972_021015 [Carpinus fangiana]